MFPNLGVFYARRVKFIDHLGLVRGTWPEQLKSQPYGSDWVHSVCYKFGNLIGYNIKNCVSLLAFQNSLLSLSPPTQVITHTHQFYIDKTSEPRIPGLIKWIMEHESYKTRGNPNLKPQIIYVNPGKKAGHIIDMKLVSQQLSFGHDSALAREIGRPSMGCFYFEFDRYDSRRSGIKAMINSFICTMACRFWDCERLVICRCADYLSRSKSWSLQDMLNLFTIVHRSCREVNKMTIILAQFDHCDERERMRFLYTMFQLQRRSEKLSSFILTTARPNDLLCEKLPPQSVISLDECPMSLAEFMVPAKRPKSTQLAPKLNRMFKKFGKSPGLQDQAQEEPPNERPESPGHRLSVSVQEPSSGTHQKLLRGRLEQLQEPTQKLMRSVYSWIKHAAEPLTPEAITEATQGSLPQEMEELGLGQGPQAFAEFVQTTMRGIIVRKGRDLRFSDDAFYDVSGSGMFQDERKLASRSHADMATVCLRYLLGREGHDMLQSLSVENQGLGDHDMTWSPITLPRHNLGSYALRFWTFHYQAAGAYRPADLATELFGDESRMRVYTEALYVTSNPFTRVQKEYMSPLPYMAMLGLDDLVRSHLQNETKRNGSNKDRWLAIVEAVRNGHRKTAILLLEQADKDHAGLAEAIHWATNKCETNEEEEVLDCLISKALRVKKFRWPPFILNRAASKGLMNLASVLVNDGYDLNERDSTGKNTAVHTAIKFGQLDVLQALVDSKRVDLTLKDEDGETPMALATRTSSPTVIIGLERAGATFSNQMEISECFYNAIRHGNFNSLAWFFIPAPKIPLGVLQGGLFLAARYGFTECVRIILGNGANPNHTSRKGESALTEAVWRGRLEICRMLLEKGANPNELKADYVPKIGIDGACREPPTLLLLAIWNKSPPLVSMLLDHGAKINGVGPDEGADLPLSVAVMTSNVEIVDLLLARGADPNFGCSCWERAACPPLIVASMYGVELVEKLIKHGAKVPGTVAASGLSPLHVALTTHGHKSLGLLKALLTNGADINATEDLNYTPLMSAATLGHIESVKVLLAQTDPKADLEVVSSREPGRTALHLALRDGYPEIVKLLIEAGADIDHQQSDGTPPVGQLLASDKLHPAREDLLEFMLKRKPNLDLADNEGNTVLHKIRSDTPLSVVVRLVVEGAPVNTFNELGFNPLACAVKCGNTDVARYLTTVKGVQSDVYHPGFGSILHIAAAHSTMEVVRQLIRTGAEHSLVNAEFGESVLYSTIGKEDKKELRKIIRYLVEEVGVDVNALGGGWGSPLLRTVAEAKGTHLMKYLLSHGARTNQVDSLGRTAAHWAVINQRRMDLETLVESGADISATDNFGRSPLHFAASKEDVNLLRYILGKLPDGAANENATDVDGWTPLMWAVKSGLSSMAFALIDEYEADACARSKDEEWSSLKVARLCGWIDEDIQRLKRR
ncbi:hypothetical protein Daus18300_005743 [Diaporthe australafricana]|uniref:Nephrocystin 3-like N-terminal domain-containing protein n=1 Tax=Diaporthe australafricana TaxID=127596 RepID=A0ABR3WZ23_9PEZI